MKRSYLVSYYPDGISMEDRLFTAGERNTRIPLGTWVAVLVVGVVVAVIGMLIAMEEDFGYFFFSLGDLAITVGAVGMGVYFSGLRCLERAELLYNTRVAGKEEEEAEEAVVAPRAPGSVPSANGVPGWLCLCGKRNADYMAVCSCGTKKQEAKQARQNAGPQRTAGGWVCSCGREHAGYVSSCTCGVSKRDIK